MFKMGAEEVPVVRPEWGHGVVEVGERGFFPIVGVSLDQLEGKSDLFFFGHAIEDEVVLA